jgi:methyltransferase-like protein/SAM-dependent methyltransferase
MTDTLLASYESFLYDSKPIAFAEIDSIAASVLLHGVTPPPPQQCRVLELGCASGGNLIPMAFRFSDSQFVGIDLAPTHIKAARLAAGELGLQNVAFHAKSVVDIDPSFGQFDYVICHGVYSWVPDEVRDAILRVCVENLTPTGIAYVSYNTYPGWYRRRMVREMLLFHDDGSLPPEQRITRARDFLKFLDTAVSKSDAQFATAMTHEIAQILDETDSQLFHEQLEPYNEPTYVVEFARRAAAKGLRYLAEARLSAETDSTRMVRQACAETSDPIILEQYLDFVVGRTFRRTLMCHQSVVPETVPLADGVQRLYVRSRVLPVPPAPSDAAAGVEAFRSPTEVTITTNNPVVIAMLRVLIDAAPAVLPFGDLHTRVRARLAEFGSADERGLADDPGALASAVLQCVPNGLVELRALPSDFVARPSKRPKGTALARWQCLHSERVATAAHTLYKLNDLERFVLRRLDGANDRAELTRLVQRGLESRELAANGGVPAREDISRVIDEVLNRLARAGLLVA